MIIVAVLGVLVVVAGIVAAAVGMDGHQVAVPSVAGMTEPQAITTLQGAGLVMVDGGTRFSVSAPEGTVVSQDPPAGSLLPRGGKVTVVFSAGAETFPMPDVIGMDASEAVRDLESRGLVVTTETVASQLASGTVIGSYPSPGVEVRRGTDVRLSVAGRSLASDILTPYALDGLVVVIDPVPRDSSPDVTAEVSRRVRALLEASGARVVVTRISSTAATTPGDRVTRATETTGVTCAIVLDVRQSAGGGIEVRGSSTVDSAHQAMSVGFTSAVVQALRSAGLDVRTADGAAEAVLSALKKPGCTIVLGSMNDPEDSAHFSDPEWADNVAQAVYRAIGATFAAGAQEGSDGGR
ncbi:MAG: PASTA domain-containing protein [Coriobacteriales bacterium]